MQKKNYAFTQIGVDILGTERASSELLKTLQTLSEQLSPDMI
jgi:hypothetical protein